MAFKMKGPPMQRNFGIGGPLKKAGIFDTTTGERISKQRAKEITESGGEGGVRYTGKDALEKTAQMERDLIAEGKLQEGQTLSSAESKKISKEQDTPADRQAQEKVQREANKKELDALRKARRAASEKKKK